MNTNEVTIDEMRRMLREGLAAYEHYQAVSQVNARSVLEQRITYARELLTDYQEYVEHIARRTPEAMMTPFQISRTNELLRICQELLKGREGAEFLLTAEENITYGEMTFLLTPYNTMMWDLMIKS